MPKATEGQLVKLYHIGDEAYGYKCISEFDPDVDLLGSYSQYGDVCPRCGSNDVCYLDRDFNIGSGWYCMLCHLRWEHGSLHCPICDHCRINYEKDTNIAYCSKCGTQWLDLDDLMIQINETYY